MGLFDSLEPIGDLFGLNGKKGAKAQTGNISQQRMMNREAAANSSENAKLKAAYGRGEISLAEAMRPGGSRIALGGYGSELDDPNLGLYQAYLSDLATDPLSGSRLASDLVATDPITGQLYGKGGAMERANTEEQQLASQGYKIKPEDVEAYGQASGDIARQFGQQEQSLSRALASRGLSQGASGSAMAGFAGLAGNKNEMLAKAQTDIADRRMQNTMQRLNATRGFLATMGGQANQAIQNQYGRQLEGANRQDRNIYNGVQAQAAQNKAENDAVDFNEGHRNKTLADAWAEGTYSGFGQGTADATKFWTSFGGSGAGFAGGGSGGGGGMPGLGGSGGSSSTGPSSTNSASRRPSQQER